MGLAAELQCWASAAAGGDEVKCCQGSSLHQSLKRRLSEAWKDFTITITVCRRKIGTPKQFSLGKALVGAFNQEKALVVGAFYVIALALVTMYKCVDVIKRVDIYKASPDSGPGLAASRGSVPVIGRSSAPLRHSVSVSMYVYVLVLSMKFRNIFTIFGEDLVKTL